MVPLAKNVVRDLKQAQCDADEASISLKRSNSRSDALSKVDKQLVTRSHGQIARVRDRFKLENVPDASRRAMLQQHLEQSKRHVAIGEKHVVRQRELIAQLERHGHDISNARELLELFEELQVMHIAHRDRLAGELGSYD